MKTHLLVASLAALAGPGCAYYATSHAPYTPLLDHAGQVDISARTGASYPGGLPVAVNAAVALVDGFEILANADFNLGSSASHYGGGVAIGTFVPTEVFRLELIGGVNGGYAEGRALEIDGSSSSDVTRNYGLSGGYLQPFGQLLLGFELTHFVFAAGVRVQGFLSNVAAVQLDGTGTYATSYERAYVEPIVTLQFPFDFVRIEVSSSLPLLVVGDNGPTPQSFDSNVQWYLAAGVGFQWDAFGESDPVDDPEGAYVPGPTVAPIAPTPITPIPPEAPSNYGTPSTPPPASPPTSGGETPPPSPFVPAPN